MYSQFMMHGQKNIKFSVHVRVGYGNVANHRKGPHA